MLTKIVPSSAVSKFNSISAVSVRSVSSKYPRPTPRPYKRRLFEAALQPILPREVKVCSAPGLIYKQSVKESREYADVELALSNLVKKWLVNEEFRVMAICQFMPAPGRNLWLTKNQWRLKGIEFRNYGNKIMKKVFEGTPLSSLDVAFTGSNAILFGKDIGSLKEIVAETDKVNWIIPLVMVVDQRILDMPTCRKLAELRSLEDIRVETVQILTSQLGQLPMTLGAQSSELVGSLSHLANSQKE